MLHGVPAADFAADELIYLPRNPRAHRLYGMSPVEQVALTVNIALRRETATLDYYRTGSTPDSFATLPKEWTVDQIRQFQDYFDALMSGNAARRRMVKFMPSDFKLIETRQPPLKDQYDEWLARVICYAFSVPSSPFVNQVNRATSQNLRQQALQEGLAPLKAWVKGMLDGVLADHLDAPDLEFTWVGDDAVDPLQQAQTLSILVNAGIKTREEARADLGLTGEGAGAPGAADALGKFNPYHDDRGRFTNAPEGGQETQNDPEPPLEIHPKNAVQPDRSTAQTRPAGNSGTPADGFGRDFTLKQLNLLPPEIKANVESGFARYLGSYHGDSQWCAALTRALVPGLGPTSLWRPGGPVQGNIDIAIGAPVATFSNEWPDGTMHYGPPESPGGARGVSHTGLYMGQDASGVYLLNQYQNSGGAVITFFPWDAAWHRSDSLESGKYYFTIRWR